MNLDFGINGLRIFKICSFLIYKFIICENKMKITETKIVYINKKNINVITLTKDRDNINILNYLTIDLRVDVFNPNPLLSLQQVLKKSESSKNKNFVCIDSTQDLEKIKDIFLNFNIEIVEYVPSTFAIYYAYKLVENSDTKSFNIKLKQLKNAWIDLGRIENTAINGMISYVAQEKLT